ncbi:MAG: hypothetical protein KC620_23775, partial [Myxococcales bacterium]|nr:hypothetical protein [Myxococcales bacterium]
MTGLFDKLCQVETLLEAIRLTARGKRSRPDVARLLSRREQVAVELAEALRSERWRPLGFRLLRVHDPKPRIIACVPLVDRVVHTALVEQIAPIFARSLMPDDFACRPGYG